MKIALQLYSVKDETAKDFLGTLAKVAEMGYDGVEFAGFFGVDAKTLKAELDRLGLKAAGSHTGLDLLKNNLDEVIAYNLEIGNPNVILPGAHLVEKKDFEDLGAFLQETGKKLKAHGLTLSYHNHAHEFVSFDGEFGLDIVFNSADPENLQTEVDTYWVYYAGVDPVEYIRKYKGRSPLVHIKDMEVVNGEKRSTDVGTGIINIAAIVAQARENGTEWLVIEQEAFTKGTLESVAIGCKNLKVINASNG